jgi:hypothetical protein
LLLWLTGFLNSLWWIFRLFQLAFLLLLFFFSHTILFALIFLIYLLRSLVFLLLEKKVNDGGTHDTVAEDTCCTRLSPSREWGIVFILRRDHVTAAFCTFFFRAIYSTRLLQDPNSEVTAVALKTPSFLAVVLDSELAIETTDAEVDHGVFALVKLRNLI